MEGTVQDGSSAAWRPPRYVIGMDAHSRKLSLCLAETRPYGDPVAVRRWDCVMLKDMEKAYEGMPSDSVTVLEASTNSFSIAKRLKTAGFRAEVMPSDILKGFSRCDRVNDRIDAEKLAVAYSRFGGSRARVFVPSPRFAAMRDLLFAYRNAVKDSTRLSNRIWAFCGANGAPLPRRRRSAKVGEVRAWADAAGLGGHSRKSLDWLLADYGRAIERRDELLREMAGEAVRDRAMLSLLQVPGVGLVTAFSLVAYVEDVRRFPTAASLVSYIGLNPSVNSSGESKAPDELSKYGQRLLKACFIQVGQVLMRESTPSAIGRWARRKRAAGKPYACMVVAAGRKAAVYCWHMLMGHPVPDREAERIFRTKLRLVFRLVGKEKMEGVGVARAGDFAEAVASAVYENLAAANQKPPDPASDAAGQCGENVSAMGLT